MLLGVASHAEELSKSFNMIFLNSEMKLLNSLLLSLAGVHSFIYLSSILKLFTKGFIKLCCFSLVDLYFGGGTWLGAVGQSFL